MTMHAINILMTGAGAPGATGIIHCLQAMPGINLSVVDADVHAIGRHLVNDFTVIPRADDPSFTETLLGICRAKNIHLLLPLVTKELIPLSNYREQFEATGTKLLLSSTASLEIANNKSRLYQFLQWRGIPVPDFRVVETVDQFATAVTELGYPEKTICFKPSVANGSRGFRIMKTEVDESAILFNEKPNASFISQADVTRILSSKPFPELLVSEYLPGEEYSVDCLANNGNTVLAVPRLRKKMINGITVAGTFVQEKSIITYCERIIHELQLHGNIGIQVKRSAAGEFLLLEINPRVQGTISAAVGAGINFPLLAVKQELHLPIANEEMSVKWGTSFLRYWENVFY